MIRLIVLMVSASAAMVPAPTAWTAPAAALVAEGERWWTTSPDPVDPVACATCHHDPSEMRGWAASFPKYRPLPPPEGRVMTLLQANAEAVRRHYGLRDPEPVAIALTAYVMSRGDGIRVSPGVVEGEPVFDGRQRALAQSVARGDRLYARRCAGCHASAAVAPAALLFPRVVDSRAESLERFISHHRPDASFSWNGQPVADLIAFMMSNLVGRPLGISSEGGRHPTPKETP
jgi:mono/diheme cytochrome c family protein